MCSGSNKKTPNPLVVVWRCPLLWAARALFAQRSSPRSGSESRKKKRKPVRAGVFRPVDRWTILSAVDIGVQRCATGRRQCTCRAWRCPRGRTSWRHSLTVPTKAKRDRDDDERAARVDEQTKRSPARDVHGYFARFVKTRAVNNGRRTNYDVRPPPQSRLSRPARARETGVFVRVFTLHNNFVRDVSRAPVSERNT